MRWLGQERSRIRRARPAAIPTNAPATTMGVAAGTLLDQQGTPCLFVLAQPPVVGGQPFMGLRPVVATLPDTSRA